MYTVLVEIIRDSKFFYFFQRSRIIWSKFQDHELFGTYVYARGEVNAKPGHA